MDADDQFERERFSGRVQFDQLKLKEAAGVVPLLYDVQQLNEQMSRSSPIHIVLSHLCKHSVRRCFLLGHANCVLLAHQTQL